MSINTDTSNETHQGPPDGTQGYLAACYRNIVDTKPSHFSKSNPESDRKSNRKPKKPNGPSRKSNRLTKKKIHIPRATLNYYLGCLMWCNVCISSLLRTKFLREQRCRGNSICCTLFQTKPVCFVQTLYQHQSALPYMGCCTLSSCSSNKGPRILGPTIQ